MALMTAMIRCAMGVALCLICTLVPVDGSATEPTEETETVDEDTAGTSADSPEAPDEKKPADEQAPAEAPVDFVPPVPLGSTDVPYPAGMPPRKDPVTVEVLILVDESGEVEAVELVRSAGEPFDTAIRDAVKWFRFEPGTFKGEPVATRISFTQKFVPPPEVEGAESDVEARPTAELVGVVYERGARVPVSGAIVVIQSAQGDPWSVVTDDDGRFSAKVDVGVLTLRISAAGYQKFLQREELAAKEVLRVKYLLMPDGGNPYETVVIGKGRRTEISRKTLRGFEMTRVPGSFGDPYRAVNDLPGVTQPLGLLPLPMVRGSSPGNTGILLDGIRLPFLFHMLPGPAVIHPEFIESMDYYPGIFPASFGGYTAGVINGRVSRGSVEESVYNAEVTLTHAGGFARQGFVDAGVTASVAGRIGYPAMILSLATDEMSLSYWDYQARVDGGTARRGWSVFVFGAGDDLKTAQPVVPEGEGEQRPEDSRPGSDGSSLQEPETELRSSLRLQFHRVDLRYHHGGASSRGVYRLVLGFDETLLGEGTSGVSSPYVQPRLSWRQELSETLRLRLGAEGSYRNVDFDEASSTEPVEEGALGDDLFGQVSGRLLESGAFVELQWRPDPKWVVVPGVRVDIYDDRYATEWSIDPRIAARYHLSDEEVGGTWLKAGVGLYHQPPRLFMPLPGADHSGLNLGLMGAVQTAVGAEVRLSEAVEVDVQVYYHHMDPVFYELAGSQAFEAIQKAPPSNPPGEPPAEAESDTSRDNALDASTERKLGRAYGIEVMLRKQTDGRFFGWASYALSRSEREVNGEWLASDYDRSQVVKLVAGMLLPRNWGASVKLLLQTGKPVTTIHGYNAGRAANEFRVDVRFDKKAIWNTWQFEFFVDIVNATVSKEGSGLFGGAGFRYVLPTFGFRALI